LEVGRPERVRAERLPTCKIYGMFRRPVGPHARAEQFGNTAAGAITGCRQKCVPAPLGTLAGKSPSIGGTLLWYRRGSAETASASHHPGAADTMTASSTRPIADTTQRFVLWCAEQLRIDVDQSCDAIRLTVPADRQRSLGGRSVVAFGTQASPSEPHPIGAASADQLPNLPPDELLDWLVQQLRDETASSSSRVVHSQPRQQPDRVQQISRRLFSAYQIDGGHVHLGGCTLEDQPLVRVTTRLRGIAGHGLHHSFWHTDGRPVSPALIDALRLDDLTRHDQRRNLAMGLSAPMLDAIHTAARTCSLRETGLPLENVECLVTTIVWCKFAEGKLRFHIGSQAVELPFSDWATTLEPPPYVCPYSGKRGFHLAATDDDRITLADQIEPCSVSGQRVLKSDLAECQVTGRHVLPQYLVTCPVCGDRLLTGQLVTCPVCRQEVSPRAIETTACRGCQRIGRISRHDPRLARLFARYPEFDRWCTFFLSETETCWIVKATGLLRERLLVVDRDTLDVRYRAWRWRGPSDFRP